MGFDCSQGRIQGLGRMQWIRVALVGTLGLVGALMAWSMFGLSLNEVAGALNQVSSAVRDGAVTVDDAGGWAAVVLLLAFGTLLVRPVFSES
jgi:hypothetical protein